MIKSFLGPALLMAALGSALAASAQNAPPTPASSPGTMSPTAPPAAPNGAPIVPGSLSGAPVQQPLPAPSAAPGLTAPPSPSAAAASPVPEPRSTSTDRVRLTRPGTDITGDDFSGSFASDVWIVRGNVILHSDPKVDREFATTESDDPITVTADEISMDRSGLAYIAKGHVHFVQGSRSGRSDIAMLNEQTHDLDLLGNADVLDGDHRIRAAKMHYNLADRKFRGFGEVRIYEPLPTPDPNATATPPPKHRRRLPL